MFCIGLLAKMLVECCAFCFEKRAHLEFRQGYFVLGRLNRVFSLTVCNFRRLGDACSHEIKRFIVKFSSKFIHRLCFHKGVVVVKS